MTPPLWLVLRPAAKGAFGLERRVAGLTTPLRLALTAQSAGAAAVHVDVEGEAGDAVARALVDARLRIPVERKAPPSEAVRIVVGADVVAHRGLFAALRDAAKDGRAHANGEGAARVTIVPAGADDTAPSPLAFTPPFGFAPLVVVDRSDASRAVSLLMRSLRKVQDGWTSTYLNRYISLTVSRLLVNLPIRPNQLSVGILGLGIASGIVAARGTWLSFVVGALLLNAQSILDGCDGELSRVTFRGSRLGEWLDTIGDDLSNYGFFAGAAFGLHRSTGLLPYVVVGAVIVGCGLLASGLEYRYLASIGSGDLLKYPLVVGGDDGKPATGAGKVFAAIQPLFKRDTFVFLTLLAALAGLLGPMLAIFAVGAIGIVIAVVKAELRMAGERRAARDRAAAEK